MQKFIVEGGFPLSGSITPSGNKNEALPILAASLLAHEPVTIRNVPDILDIAIMRNLLVSLGVKIKQIDKHSFRIDSNHLRTTILESEQAKLIRGSFLLVRSALLPARTG